MLKTYFFLSLFFTGIICHGQRAYESKIYSNQFELRHDNDFFVLTDRYYSSGLFITYRTALEKGIFGDSEQLGFKLGQEVFTPSQTQSTDSAIFDRPYAGFAGLWTNWSIAGQRDLFQIRFLLGLAGLNSGAGGFQRWYHRAVAISDSPLWIDELNGSFHTNLYASYVQEWELAPNPFGVRFALVPQLAIGSRDIFAETEAVVQFGRRNSIKESIAYNRLGDNAREIYFAFRFGYRYVVYNGLIEGNLFGDDSAVLRNPETSLLRLGFDFNHRFDKNDFKVGIRYSAPETPTSESHIFLQLSYGLSF